MNPAFIAKGHGYESGTYGRCTAFDGYQIIAHPLPGDDDKGRESRVFGRQDNGNGGTTYGAYQIRLARRGDSGRDLYLLVSHGAGREVWLLPSFYDRGELEREVLALPERLQFALLFTIYRAMSTARQQAQDETRREWAQAIADGRIKKHRATKSRGARIEIIPPMQPTAA